MFAGIVFLAGNQAYAQDAVATRAVAVEHGGISDEELNLLRKDIRSLKKQIIAANLNLTDEEAQRFWPLYDQYMVEMTKLFDKKFAAIKEFAANYAALTDEQADAYIKGRTAAEDAIMQLRLKYVPMFRKVLSGKTAARFTQIDWRLGLALDLQLNEEIPIIEP
jgi:Spy/CpxP family protein refolding chaperone